MRRPVVLGFRGIASASFSAFDFLFTGAFVATFGSAAFSSSMSSFSMMVTFALVVRFEVLVPFAFTFVTTSEVSTTDLIVVSVDVSVVDLVVRLLLGPLAFFRGDDICSAEDESSSRGIAARFALAEEAGPCRVSLGGAELRLARFDGSVGFASTSACRLGGIWLVLLVKVVRKVSALLSYLQIESSLHDVSIG